MVAPAYIITHFREKGRLRDAKLHNQPGQNGKNRKKTADPQRGKSDAVNRLSEFAWYHINGDCEANGMVMKQYADMKGLRAQDRLDLCFFYTLTYSVPSAIYLLQNRKVLETRSADELERFKTTVFFQSDRRFMRLKKRFSNSIAFWKDTFAGKADSIIKTLSVAGMLRESAEAEVQTWYEIARYAACLFLEAFCCMFGIKTSNKVNEQFENGSVFTAGIFNCFGLDRTANRIDKGDMKPEEKAKAHEMLGAIKAEIKRRGGDDNYYFVETTLCAYRKHFKGTRYNGYYADRQLEEIDHYRKAGQARLCEDFFRAREAALPRRYLGEVNGWNGIRTPLKKSYQSGAGIIGMKAD